MGPKHSSEEILAGAVEVAFAEGLSQITFGRVAGHLGISDRTVVYYFATKDDLLTEVLLSLGARLQSALGEAFTGPADGHLDLARAAWPVLARSSVDPVFALFFEATGLAAAGREPHRTLVPQLVEAWIDWLTTLFEGRPARRRTEATATIALLDGLLLLRQTVGPEAAERAASALGVR
ncbi:MAG: TetR/AcrR family transcriptional regulator [Acidimicrobiales bacterium]|jgi:AcrR family transcriptional regulator|nr:TetR/AcrR family transcriptional regulator [Acidimicrobiales bacterium]